MAADTPSRLIYMAAILDTLRATGGSASSTDVYNDLRDRGVARTSDIAAIQPSGETRFAKEVRFARKELFDAALLGGSARGTWTLTSDGWRTVLTPPLARELIRSRRHAGSASRRDGAGSGAGPPGATIGPSPSGWSGFVSRTWEGGAWTYALRFGLTDVWKIGFASDVEGRLSEINCHVPFEVIGSTWSVFARYYWDDPSSAYQAEQSILRRLSASRTHGERVRCSEAAVLAAWKAAIADLILETAEGAGA